jgi:hypothetical protein
MIVSALSLGERVARVASQVRGFFPQGLATSEFGFVILPARMVLALEFLLHMRRKSHVLEQPPNEVS